MRESSINIPGLGWKMDVDVLTKKNPTVISRAVTPAASQQLLVMGFQSLQWSIGV